MSKKCGFPVTVGSDQPVLPALGNEQARVGEQVLALRRDRKFVDLYVYSVLHLYNIQNYVSKKIYIKLSIIAQNDQLLINNW